MSVNHTSENFDFTLSYHYIRAFSNDAILNMVKCGMFVNEGRNESGIITMNNSQTVVDARCPAAI